MRQSLNLALSSVTDENEEYVTYRAARAANYITRCRNIGEDHLRATILHASNSHQKLR